MAETDFWAHIHTPAAQAEQHSRVVQAQAASAAKMTALQAREAEFKAAQNEKAAAHAEFLARVQANRAAIARGDIQSLNRADMPSLAQLRETERLQLRQDAKQQEAAARQGMTDFVLRNLPRNDPKMVAYRAAIINPPERETKA